MADKEYPITRRVELTPGALARYNKRIRKLRENEPRDMVRLQGPTIPEENRDDPVGTVALVDIDNEGIITGNLIDHDNEIVDVARSYANNDLANVRTTSSAVNKFITEFLKGNLFTNSETGISYNFNTFRAEEKQKIFDWLNHASENFGGDGEPGTTNLSELYSAVPSRMYPVTLPIDEALKEIKSDTSKGVSEKAKSDLLALDIKEGNGWHSEIVFDPEKQLNRVQAENSRTGERRWREDSEVVGIDISQEGINDIKESDRFGSINYSHKVEYDEETKTYRIQATNLHTKEKEWVSDKDTPKAMETLPRRNALEIEAEIKSTERSLTSNLENESERIPKLYEESGIFPIFSTLTEPENERSALSASPLIGGSATQKINELQSELRRAKAPTLGDTFYAFLDSLNPKPLTGEALGAEENKLRALISMRARKEISDEEFWARRDKLNIPDRDHVLLSHFVDSWNDLQKRKEFEDTPESEYIKEERSTLKIIRGLRAKIRNNETADRHIDRLMATMRGERLTGERDLFGVSDFPLEKQGEVGLSLGGPLERDKAGVISGLLSKHIADKIEIARKFYRSKNVPDFDNEELLQNMVSKFGMNPQEMPENYIEYLESIKETGNEVYDATIANHIKLLTVEQRSAEIILKELKESANIPNILFKLLGIGAIPITAEGTMGKAFIPMSGAMAGSEVRIVRHETIDDEMAALERVHQGKVADLDRKLRDRKRQVADTFENDKARIRKSQDVDWEDQIELARQKMVKEKLIAHAQNANANHALVFELQAQRRALVDSFRPPSVLVDPANFEIRRSNANQITRGALVRKENATTDFLHNAVIVQPVDSRGSDISQSRFTFVRQEDRPKIQISNAFNEIDKDFEIEQIKKLQTPKKDLEIESKKERQEFERNTDREKSRLSVNTRISTKIQGEISKAEKSLESEGSLVTSLEGASRFEGLVKDADITASKVAEEMLVGLIYGRNDNKYRNMVGAALKSVSKEETPFAQGVKRILTHIAPELIDTFGKDDFKFQKPTVKIIEKIARDWDIPINDRQRKAHIFKAIPDARNTRVSAVKELKEIKDYEREATRKGSAVFFQGRKPLNFLVNGTDYIEPELHKVTSPQADSLREEISGDFERLIASPDTDEFKAAKKGIRIRHGQGAAKDVDQMMAIIRKKIDIERRSRESRLYDQYQSMTEQLKARTPDRIRMQVARDKLMHEQMDASRRYVSSSKVNYSNRDVREHARSMVSEEDAHKVAMEQLRIDFMKAWRGNRAKLNEASSWMPDTERRNGLIYNAHSRLYEKETNELDASDKHVGEMERFKAFLQRPDNFDEATNALGPELKETFLDEMRRDQDIETGVRNGEEVRDLFHGPNLDSVLSTLQHTGAYDPEDKTHLDQLSHEVQWSTPEMDASHELLFGKKSPMTLRLQDIHEIKDSLAGSTSRVKATFAHQASNAEERDKQMAAYILPDLMEEWSGDPTLSHLTEPTPEGRLSISAVDEALRRAKLKEPLTINQEMEWQPDIPETSDMRPIIRRFVEEEHPELSDKNTVKSLSDIGDLLRLPERTDELVEKIHARLSEEYGRESRGGRLVPVKNSPMTRAMILLKHMEPSHLQLPDLVGLNGLGEPNTVTTDRQTRIAALINQGFGSSTDRAGANKARKASILNPNYNPIANGKRITSDFFEDTINDIDKEIGTRFPGYNLQRIKALHETFEGGVKFKGGKGNVDDEKIKEQAGIAQDDEYFNSPLERGSKVIIEKTDGDQVVPQAIDLQALFNRLAVMKQFQDGELEDLFPETTGLKEEYLGIIAQHIGQRASSLANPLVQSMFPVRQQERIENVLTGFGLSNTPKTVEEAGKVMEDITKRPAYTRLWDHPVKQLSRMWNSGAVGKAGLIGGAGFVAAGLIDGHIKKDHTKEKMQGPSTIEGERPYQNAPSMNAAPSAPPNNPSLPQGYGGMEYNIRATGNIDPATFQGSVSDLLGTNNISGSSYDYPDSVGKDNTDDIYDAYSG